MKRLTSKLGAAALAAGLLCGYTLQNGAINWAYFGTPLTSQPYELANGRPTITEYTRRLPVGLPPLPADLAAKIRYTLPEGRDIRLNAQGLIPDSDDKTNVRFSEDAEVHVSFLSEGAGYRNSVGYFVYDPASPPRSAAEVAEKIIFSNASMPMPLDAAGTYQNTVHLGRFSAGQALGFVIVSDGFSETGRQLNGASVGGTKGWASPKWIFYTLRQLNPEAPGPQNLNVHSIVLKDLADSGDGYQRLVLAFEDINRESGGDHDFNDVVLAVHVTPGRAIQNLATLQPLVGSADLDSDGDGVKDALDEFPNDPTRAFSRYYPGADTWGTLAYEDQWPQRGDFDLNDVVMRYRTREVLNAARQVVAMDVDYRLEARGALADSGFALRLPGVAAAAVASATLSVGNVPARALAVEAGQTEASFVVMPSAQALMPLPSDPACPYANTRSGCAAVPAVAMHLQVNFVQPLASTLFAAPYDPFIFRSQRRGQEVHLPGKQPTRLAEAALLRTGADASVAGTSFTYMDKQRRPWALDIPTAWVWPRETTDLLRAYPRLADWATSGGANARDWYLYGVSQHVYTQP